MGLGRSTTLEPSKKGVRAQSRHSLRPPLGLLVPALLVVVAMLMPLGYLLLRTATADANVLAQLARPATLAVFARTLLLAVSVTGSCTLLGVVLAWLTVATDMPGRRTFAVLVVLPLVVPTYIGGYAVVSALGPRGALQTVLNQLFGIERLPELYGFWGAWLALTLFSYPYVVPSACGRNRST